MSSVKLNFNTMLLEYLLGEGNFLLEDENDLNKSELFQRFIFIKVAQTYSNVGFYVPLQADWRGRIYTQSFFANYQGGDLALSLIEFYNGECLSKKGINSLYIYGANNYNENNISKAPYTDRINWVQENLDNILSMEPEFIQRAENKFVFASFCLTMRELNKKMSAV